MGIDLCRRPGHVADEVGQRVGARRGRLVRHATRSATRSAAASILGSGRANDAMQQQDAEDGRQSLRAGNSFSEAWLSAPPVHIGELAATPTKTARLVTAGERRL